MYRCGCGGFSAGGAGANHATGWLDVEVRVVIPSADAEPLALKSRITVWR